MLRSAIGLRAAEAPEKTEAFVGDILGCSVHRRGMLKGGATIAKCASISFRMPRQAETRRDVPPISCRSQIESSYSQPSRKFRFSGRVAGPDGNVRIASPGSRLAGLSKAEATGLAPKQSAGALL